MKPGNPPVRKWDSSSVSTSEDDEASNNAVATAPVVPARVVPDRVVPERVGPNRVVPRKACSVCRERAKKKSRAELEEEILVKVTVLNKSLVALQDVLQILFSNPRNMRRLKATKQDHKRMQDLMSNLEELLNDE